jgi:tetrahydromethanopterin S-methyltransferase subunit G
MWISRKDINELFSRVREVEKHIAVNKEHDNNLEELFIKHDKEEMIKYDKIQKRLDDLYKILYLVFGGFIFLETLHKFGLISF